MKSKRWVIVGVVSALFVVYSYLALDRELASYFYSIKESGVRAFFKDITFLGESQYYLIPTLLIYLLNKNRDSQASQKALYLFLSVALSGILIWVFKIVGGRYRPEHFLHEGLYGFDFFHVVHDMTSFPSGHSTTIFAFSTAVWLLYRRFGVALFSLSLLVALSRVVIDRHYLSDVVAGAFIGSLFSYWLYEKRFRERIEG